MRVLAISLAFAAGGCIEEAADPIDPSPYLGCYQAENGPDIEISSDKVAIGGGGIEVPYRIESRKVGPVLSVPLAAEKKGTQLLFASSDEHYFSFVMLAKPPTLRISAAPDGEIYVFTRSSVSCASMQTKRQS